MTIDSLVSCTERAAVPILPDTIFALSSAPGRAAVAVVRISGPRAKEALGRLAGHVPETRKATLRTIRHPSTGQDIDRAIILFFAGPSSFTGEDVAEILLHGGKAVVASVLNALGTLQCRLAEPGEFARRAFDNGKMDLTEAEGIADLIDAETEAQRVQAVAQAGGMLRRLYDAWRSDVLDAMALTEAAIDFSDEEDVAADAAARARDIIAGLVDALAKHLKDGRRGEILRAGFRVVLAGAPNVGKSSLLNALARRDAAIVSSEAGTTRDVIEVRLDLDGFPVIVSDTAGIRDGGGEIEREGIRRTLERGREADLVLWVRDATETADEVPRALLEAGAAIILVENKVDLVSGEERAGAESQELLRVSAASGAGLGALVTRIAMLARERIAPTESPVLTQARHREALEDCMKCLEDHLSQNQYDAELAAEDLRRASQALGRITGVVDAEEVLGRIFARFCIGK